MPELDPWDTWFNAQYELTDMIRQHLAKYKSKSDHFKAALIFGVIESLSEDIRQYLTLPPSDAKPDDVMEPINLPNVETDPTVPT